MSLEVHGIQASHTFLQGPPILKAEVKGQQSELILAVFLTKLVLLLVKSQGTNTEMSQEKVIYVEPKFLYSEKKEDKRYQSHKRKESPWHIIAIILGIVCLFLLLAITVLGYMYFETNSKCNTQDMKDTNERNASVPGAEDHSVLPPSTVKGYGIYQGKWSCYGKDCYYFSKEEKTWMESKQSCQDLGSSLIKIDDQEEQVFIQSKIKYSHWIGLEKRGVHHPWKWLDGTNTSKNLDFQNSNDGRCGCLKSINIIPEVCTKLLPYICKKSLLALIIN
ncbi:C-type lectin domain family 7 member A-like [Cervus elaphus]|uniref:C-type lectin domain family 7 member A-like n=1 Tax=Cervus elaphus TaxID=9860 RepID=UPI001CC32561|nr:C-type lectin domain family 7 member A-like [Cervus elaphus]